MSRGRVKRLAAVLGTTMALSAYGLVLAAPASAAATCSVAGGVINVTSDVAGTLAVQVRNPSGQIFVDLGAGFDPVNTCPGTPSIALLSTTTAINVNADGTNQEFDLWLNSGGTASGHLVNWGKINWTVNLGGDSGVTPRDSMLIYNSSTAQADAVDVVLGANGIDLNNDGDVDVTVSGIENFEVYSESDGEDSISGAGSTATGAAFTLPILGVDGVAGGEPGIFGADAINAASTFPYNWLEGGAANDDILGDGFGYADITGGGGSDRMDCGGYGTADFYDQAAAVTVNLTAGIATMASGTDTIVGCDDVQGSPQGDTITGNDNGNWIAPSGGDDVVTGGLGEDTASYWDADGAVTVDLTAGTATGGSGNDTLSSIEDAEGGSAGDTLKGTATANYLFGAGGNDTLVGKGGSDDLVGYNGIDTVSYKWASSVDVELTDACDVHDGQAVYTGGSDSLDTIENAKLTSGDDSFEGSQFQNTVFPMGGQNTLIGDCMSGGFVQNSGGDTLNYSKGYGHKGVEVNMAGGATAGDSATAFEAAVGSNGPDQITGNEVSNNIQGGKGQDNILGGSGDDNLKGGKGADTIRGGSGDDNLTGNGGKDAGYGGNGDDWGKGLEKAVSIELGPSA